MVVLCILLIVPAFCLQETLQLHFYQIRANGNGGSWHYYTTNNSSIAVKEISVVALNDSTAYNYSGVQYIAYFCCVTQKGFSILIYFFNRASIMVVL